MYSKENNINTCVVEFIENGITKNIFKEMLDYIYQNHVLLISERGQKHKESINPIVMTIINPSIGPTNKLIDEHILEYFPTLFMEEYAIKVASGIHEEGFDYSYGERIYRDNQLNACIEKLKKFPNTRQGTITIRVPSDIYMNHPPCMTTLNFKIRNNKLDTFVFFRSNDALFGWPGDYIEVLYIASRVAGEIGIEMNYIRTQSESMHYYVRNEELVKLIIGKI